MSFLFKFIDSGFLLTLGLILLMSGGIMLYCYRRLNLLEKSVIEHGKILQNFIINYNIQMQHFSLLNKSLNTYKNNDKNNDNDTNVVNTRNEYVDFDKIKKINLGEKISVSDDEDDEDDDEEVDVSDDKDKDIDDDDEDDDDDDDDDDEDEDDDDEDEDDDEDDDDTDDEYKKNTIRKDNLENLIISNNKLEDELEHLEDLEELEELTDITNSRLNEQTISSIDDEMFLKNLPINLNSFTLDDTNNNPKIITLENIDNSNDKTSERKNYSKMKVDDLKTLVVTKNLIDNETAQKMKKSDLVKLLQN
jgi:hypothetical protein